MEELVEIDEFSQIASTMKSSFNVNDGILSELYSALMFGKIHRVTQ